jgi:Domain of unknown function (DUF4124)
MQRTCDETQWQPAGRLTRWYEWLAILLIFGVVGSVRAEAVFKCGDAQGTIAYQSQPCATDQTAREIEIAPAPAFSPPPQYAIDPPQKPTSHEPRTVRHERREKEPTAFECRASDGQVFYRHSGCPHSVAGDAPSSGNGKHGSDRDMNKPVSVSGRRVPLDEACRQMHTAGAIGRSGHAHDETASTYDRNLGRDPCR